MAPYLRGTRYPLLSPEEIKWLLRDEFTTALAAGSVNGTNAEPGPGVRTVVDTLAKAGITRRWANIVVDGNSLTYGFGLASPATEAYPAQTMALLPDINNADWKNLGISGQTTPAMDFQSSAYYNTELDAGTLTIGLIYVITACTVDYFYMGCAIGDFFCAASTTSLSASNKVKQVISWDTVKSSGSTVNGVINKIISCQADHFYPGCTVGDIWLVSAGDSSHTIDANNTVKPQLNSIGACADYRVSPLYGTNNVLVAWELCNDLAIGTSPADAVANFVTYCNNRKTAGWNKIIALTCLPRSTVGFNALRNTANALMKAEASPPWDALVDLDAGDAGSKIGYDGASDDLTYYQADKLHLNATGAGIVAAAVSPYLDAQVSIYSGGLVEKQNTYGNPGIWYAGQPRTAGVGIFTTIEQPKYQVSKDVIAGWFSSQSAAYSHVVRFYNNTNEIALQYTSTLIRTVGHFSVDTFYKFAVFPKTTAGYYVFCLGGIYDKWTLLYSNLIGTDATIYPGVVSNTNANLTRYVRVKNVGRLLTPLLSDGFGGSQGPPMAATDGLGHTSTVNFDDGGAGRTWTGATWRNESGYSANRNIALGATLASGSLTPGYWYKIIAQNGTDHFYTGNAANDLFVATVTTPDPDANNTVKELTNMASGAYCDLGKSDIYLVGDQSSDAQNSVGYDICADALVNPQNFIRIYYNRLTGKTCMDKYLGGAYSQIFAATQANTGILTINKIGNRIIVRLGLNVSGIYSLDSVVDAAIVNNTIHGLFSTQVDHAHNYVCIYDSVGSDDILNAYSAV